MKGACRGALFTAALVAGSVFYFTSGEEPARSSAIGVGDADALSARYEQWRSARAAAGAGAALELPLGYVKGLSDRHSDARGRMTLDLAEGSLGVELEGLAGENPLEFWLVDNLPGPGHSVRPEPGDRAIRIGRMAVADGRARLETRLDAGRIAGFEIDLAVVTPAGVAPEEGGLLFGAPSLFQKLAFGGPARVADPSAETPEEPVLAGLLAGLVPSPAFADEHSGGPMQQLVDRGEELFFEETFAGNGRTCGTCHPAENNFTIDPAFIATLPDDDPLFVAEQIPALEENFEDPGMMRSLGLILENVDGFGDLENRFVLRGVPHTLGLPTSMGVDPTAGFPAEATGWSADGAPGGGSLREFAIGAVTQHFPLSLNRTPGVDFRLPTDLELDAMEAFQLSLGRQADIDLAALAMRDLFAARGKVLFSGEGRCNGCHLNGGGNFFLTPGVNANFDTDVENLVPSRERERRPVDGGFGTSPGTIETGFGTGAFNTPTVIEAADTPPFFHNNTAETLEDAIRFYRTSTFRRSPVSQALGGLSISLNQNDIEDIGAFLRVLNALENVRSASHMASRARDTGEDGKAASLLVLAAAETNDGVGVLLGARGGIGIHRTDAVQDLLAAANTLLTASGTGHPPTRRNLIDSALARLQAARAAMVNEVS